VNVKFKVIYDNGNSVRFFNCETDEVVLAEAGAMLKLQDLAEQVVSDALQIDGFERWQANRQARTGTVKVQLISYP
jgi:hypothetical protein